MYISFVILLFYMKPDMVSISISAITDLPLLYSFTLSVLLICLIAKESTKYQRNITVNTSCVSQAVDWASQSHI